MGRLHLVVQEASKKNLKIFFNFSSFTFFHVIHTPIPFTNLNFASFFIICWILVAYFPYKGKTVQFSVRNTKFPSLLMRFYFFQWYFDMKNGLNVVVMIY